MSPNEPKRAIPGGTGETAPDAGESSATKAYRELSVATPRVGDLTLDLLNDRRLRTLLAAVPFSPALAQAAASEPVRARAPSHAPRSEAVEAEVSEPPARAATRGESLAQFPRDVRVRIARVLDKPVDDLVGEDLVRVVNLNLSGAGVSDLNFFAQIQNLERLTLMNTQVSDVIALAQLRGLVYLDLDGTQVSDVSALAQLQNLERLFLTNTQVSDVSALAQLQNLQSLYLSNTQVSQEAKAALTRALPNLTLRS